jgi:D-3-phosphoglycerate dehydrogenase
MRANYYGDRALAGLRALGDVVMHDGADVIGDEALADLAAGCDILVSDRATHLDAARIAHLRDVAAILRVAVDIRNIDVAAASAAGILVCHASRTWVPAVSELIMGLVIDAARGISRANIAYKSGQPSEIRRGLQLAGAAAGIIGYGPLGRRVAQLCHAFDMRVLVNDPYVEVNEPGIEQTTFERVCRDADVVLPLAVATAETENLIDARALALMKPTALLVNASRGNLIDETALADALDRGVIAGAACDVGRAADQMPSALLARRADVSATPHIGGLTPDAIEGQALETVEQARALLSGRMPTGAVNGEQATRIAQLVTRL